MTAPDPDHPADGTTPDAERADDTATADGATEDGATGPEDGAGPDATGTGEVDGAPRSGLRNPPAAMRGAGAATLVIEALVLLLALLPLRMLGTPGWGIGLVAGLPVLCLVLTGLLRFRWSWFVGIGLQVLVVASGVVVHWSVGFIGLVFGAIWIYMLRLRRTVLGRI